MTEDAIIWARFFTDDGRLLDLPLHRSKRLAVLDRVAQRFEPGRRYLERDVDAALKEVFHDHAALRRHLVDAGLLTREHNVYWRSGGTDAV